MTKSTKHQHFALHKPYGYLSQFIVNGKQKKRNKLLGDLYDFPEGTMAIGRLDRDSEGLLLLTTDGKVSYEVLSSKYEKEYYVQVDGILTKEAIKQLKKGVEIGFEGKKYITKPCKASLIKDPNIDAIILTTPHSLHARHTILALKNNKQFILPKIQYIENDFVMYAPRMGRTWGNADFFTMILDGKSAEDIISSYENELSQFIRIRDKYLLYK